MSKLEKLEEKSQAKVVIVPANPYQGNQENIEEYNIEDQIAIKPESNTESHNAIKPEIPPTLNIVEKLVADKESSNVKIAKITTHIDKEVFDAMVKLETAYKIITGKRLTHNGIIEDALRHYLPLLTQHIEKTTGKKIRTLIS